MTETQMEPSNSLLDSLTDLLNPTDRWTKEEVLDAVASKNNPLLHDMAGTFQSKEEELEASMPSHKDLAAFGFQTQEVTRNKILAKLIRDNTKEV